MTQELDDKFFDRADAHILLANEQLAQVSRGKVSASMLYAAARFNAWVTACGSSSQEQLAAARSESIEYFIEQYRKVLEENLDDYIRNFQKYMQPGDKHSPAD